jgi:D-galacturonate reductase
MNPGDIASVFTPDDTHFEIVKACLEKGLHVMCTKPMVKTLEDHKFLVDLAKKNQLML